MNLWTAVCDPLSKFCSCTATSKRTKNFFTLTIKFNGILKSIQSIKNH